MGLFSLIGGILGGKSTKKAADKAGQLQYDAAMRGIDESARQYDQTRDDYQPFRDAGYGGLEGMGDLIGINGAEAQQSGIDMLRESPMYQSLYDNGREAILANASATGGLRGGNTQGALADFGRDTLSSTIRTQLADYGGLAGMGMGATDAVSGFGAQAVAAQNALRNQGAGAQAQAALVRAGVNAQNWNNAGGFLDSAMSAAAGGGGFSWGKLF